MATSGELICRGVTLCDFTKYEVFGNDYLVIDRLRSSLAMTPRIASLVAHRKQGIGADGILWGPFPESSGIRLKVYNADGSECPRSGNGIRVFAHYLRKQGYVREDQFSIRTAENVSPVEIIGMDTAMVKVGLGYFSPDSHAIRAKGDRREMMREVLQIGGRHLTISCVSNGAPHCIVFRNELPNDLEDSIGPLISNSPIFPEGINVAVVEVKDRRTITAELWERGAGAVPSSGSAAAAAAFIVHLLGYVDSNVAVQMQGGTLSVSISSSREASIAGMVQHVAEGVFSASFRSMLEQDDESRPLAKSQQ
ncbi:diaminopimelate epimerase [Rhizobium sp. BT-175]|uniref:diaminopimelate epimerase n=1 Tax=Rhizobium sp. BT-175 TaxID=2986929 RepID=UPI0022361517|nr:diaminopimelate epimerase [Rhizobium sp. BT-175]MCV9947656.1 diaminopimelate epimerase [Rhizobium sp. BT-175]